MQEDAVDVHRRALHRIFLRTSEAAFQLKPYSDVPPRIGDGLLDLGEHKTDFCKNCVRHSVPLETFLALPEGRAPLILEHFCSCWLDESCAHVRQMHQRFLTESCATASTRTLDIVRDFFGFNLSKTPPIFAKWIGRVFRREVRWLEERMAAGLPSGGPPHAWAEVATSLAAAFRRELELELKKLPTVPETTLTEFEKFAGSLFNDALEESATHRVSASALLAIADRLDQSGFTPLLNYLERAHRANVAEYNQKAGTKRALTSWRKLAAIQLIKAECGDGWPTPLKNSAKVCTADLRRRVFRPSQWTRILLVGIRMFCTPYKFHTTCKRRQSRTVFRNFRLANVLFP
jgi:hypothetical protein